MSGSDALSPGLAALLDRVRRNLGQRPPSGEPPPADAALLRLASADEDLALLFTQRARALGAEVERITEAELCDRVLAAATAAQAQRVALGLDDPALTSRLSAALSGTGCACVDWRAAAGLEAHYDVLLGVTDARAALAESGALVLSSGAAHSRGTLLLPPFHLVVLRAARILPDLCDYWPLHAREDRALSSATILVAGPSKTADIEGVLVTGVHGPKTLRILLVEGGAPSAG